MNKDWELSKAIRREMAIIKCLKKTAKPQAMALLELPEELRSEEWRSL